MKTNIIVGRWRFSGNSQDPHFFPPESIYFKITLFLKKKKNLDFHDNPVHISRGLD